MSLTTISAPRPAAGGSAEVKRPPRPGRAALRRPYTGEQEWQETGACRTADPSLFFAPEQESPTRRDRRERAAKSICADCPVMAQCRSYALATSEPYGVWGGLTERERARMLNLRGRFDRQDRAPGRERAESGVDGGLSGAGTASAGTPGARRGAISTAVAAGGSVGSIGAAEALRRLAFDAHDGGQVHGQGHGRGADRERDRAAARAALLREIEEVSRRLRESGELVDEMPG